MSSGQQVIWLQDQFDPDWTWNTVTYRLGLPRAVHRSEMNAALDSVISRHTALRTAFPADAAGAFQHVRAHRPEARTWNLTETGRSVFEEHRAYLTRFSLEEGDLIGAWLHGDGDESSTVDISIHHVASDAGSAAIVIRDLLLHLSGRPGDSAPSGTFKDWIVRTASEQHVRNAALVEFWQARSSDFAHPVTWLRTGMLTQHRTDSGFIPLSTRLHIERRATELGVTPFTVLLSLAHLAISGFAAVPKMNIAVPMSLRDVQARDTVGCFVNTVPVTLTLPDRGALDDIIRSHANNLNSASKNRLFPTQNIYRMSRVDRPYGRMPVCQVSVNYTRLPDTTDWAGVTVEPVLSPETRYDVSIDFMEGGSGTYYFLRLGKHSSNHFSIGSLRERFDAALKDAFRDTWNPAPS